MFFNEKGEAARQWPGVTHQQGARAAERTYASIFSFSPSVLRSCSVHPSAYTICRQEIHLYLLRGLFLQGPIFTHTRSARSWPQAVNARWFTGCSCDRVPMGVWEQCAAKGHTGDTATHTQRLPRAFLMVLPRQTKFGNLLVYFTLLKYLPNIHK